MDTCQRASQGFADFELVAQETFGEAFGAGIAVATGVNNFGTFGKLLIG